MTCSDEMINTQLSIQEIGAIELALKMASFNESMSNRELEELEGHCSNGTLDDLLKWCKGFDHD